MTLTTPRLRLAASLGMALCLLAFGGLPADCETDASPDDPGFVDYPYSKCDEKSGDFFHCKNGTCSEIGEYKPDMNGDVTLTFGGQTFKIHVGQGNLAPMSAKFSATMLGMVKCSHIKCKITCKSHGYGCGKWHIYKGKGCALPVKEAGAVNGWASGCAAHP